MYFTHGSEVVYDSMGYERGGETGMDTKDGILFGSTD
jgi:hypothetical protein